MADFPLVLSMTDVANFQRCRKLFQFSAVQNLTPRETNEAVADGLAFHEIVAHYTRTQAWPPDADPDMLGIAQDYLRFSPLPEMARSYAEKPFFVEALPNVFVRFTCDLLYVPKDEKRIVIRDYKTFAKAPSLDVDLDFQAKTYLTLAKLWTQAPDAVYEFEWHHVRREAGRFLKVKDQAVWTPWPDDDRYLFHSMILTPEESSLFARELIDCLTDIQTTIEHSRFYRTALKGKSPYLCGNCFYRSLCSQDAANGGFLTPDDIERLTMAPNSRFSLDDVLDDPRIAWYVANENMSQEQAAKAVYGSLLK